jgi:hypothetical protein
MAEARSGVPRTHRGWKPRRKLLAARLTASGPGYESELVKTLNPQDVTPHTKE